MAAHQPPLPDFVSLDALRLRGLAECEWIGRRENLLLIGRHGTGKSHAATVLGVEACRRTHRVLFTTAAELTDKLIEARAEHELQRYMKRLARFPLLVLDEVGYIPFSDRGAQLLFQVIADRYERASTLVTTNLPFAQWTKVFGDAPLTAALLDRLTHRATILEFDWESIRLAESLKRGRRRGKSGDSASAPSPDPPASSRKGGHRKESPSQEISRTQSTSFFSPGWGTFSPSSRDTFTLTFRDVLAGVTDRQSACYRRRPLRPPALGRCALSQTGEKVLLE